MDQIHIGGVKVNGVTGTVNIGTGVQWAIQSVSKGNTGNGSVSGDYAWVPVGVGLVHDPDLIDAPQLTAHFWRRPPGAI